MRRFNRILVITKKTRLEELLERFVTRSQAKFYIEHMGLSFSDYEAAHAAYKNSLEMLQDILPGSPRHLIIDREFLPTFSFNDRDLVIVFGNNGLVVNTAKYLKDQPILGINANPEREEGVLVPFDILRIQHGLDRIIQGRFKTREVTMAKATLNDGQELLAVNDLFIGHRSHVSARYRILYNGSEEDQISSGIIVSTGAGSTGWMKSIVTGALGLRRSLFGDTAESYLGYNYHFDWSSSHLIFAVREPWPSIRSHADIVFGRIDEESILKVISHMPEGGVIFSDGIERDAINFNSGAIASIGVAEERANIITETC
jgi:NAD kinase